MEKLFSKMVIVGVGLLGGSIGKAARLHGLAEEVIGLCRTAQRGTDAIRYGAVDRYFVEMQELARFCGESGSVSLPILLVIGSPVGVIADLAEALGRAFTPFEKTMPRCILTDVGSTKGEIVRQLANTVFPKSMTFIGSHPIAGSEQSGVQAADENLFRGKVTVITPDLNLSSSQKADLDLVVRFWNALGSRTVFLDPKRHDSLLARTSHLPHLLSVTLANLIPNEEHEFCGTGFSDLTRLAGGSPEVWIDILEANREGVLDALSRYQEALTQWKVLLQEGQHEQILTLLKEAKKKRNALGS